MKIANWNLARAKSQRQRKDLRNVIDQVNADVWVFTETRDFFNDVHLHSCSSVPREKEGAPADPDEKWVSISSRYPLSPIPTFISTRTAAALIQPAGADPFIVYGTVLPWLTDKWRDPRAPHVHPFERAIEVQSKDWAELRERWPALEFFVLGDLNQDLAPSHYYGSRANRKLLEQSLSNTGLEALTAGFRDPVRAGSPPLACIDHICARSDSRWVISSIERWPDTATPDKRLSDHFGVSVTLA